MAGIVDCSDFCRLCLVKEQVNNPIFEDDGRNRQVHTKISTCLPVKVTWEDALPKRICDGCNYKLDQQFQFWSTSVNSEKQLKQWLGIVDEEEPKPAVKTKKEKLETSASKRPRRNARRKAVQNIRQAVAAQQQSDSDDGEPLASLVDRDSDFDYNDTITKEETNSENDFPSNNTDSVEPTTFVNVTLDNEIGQAGPSGIQKPSVADTGETEAPEGSLLMEIKQEPNDDYEATYSDQPPRGYTKVKNKIQCALCDKTFVKLSRWRSHYQHHEAYKDVPEGLSAMNKNGRIYCNLCNRKIYYSKFKAHVESHSTDGKLKSDEKDEFFLENGRVCCKLCDKTFTKPCDWRRHFTVHSKARPHECTQCGKCFKVKSQLKTHVRVHDTDRETFACSICHKQFARLNTARMCERNHSAKFNFSCSECGKGFHYQSLLDIHVEVKHNPVKQECTICKKVFTNKINFNRHNRIHDPNYAKLELGCEICGKVYDSRKTFIRHLKSHEGFACDTCGKIFRYSHGLKLHMLIHRGERPFSCEVCGKCFNKKQIMIVHRRTHTNEKPYSCDVCGKRFTQRSPLVIHMRGHTGERPYHCPLCSDCFVSKNYLRIHMQNLHDCPNI